ncbi:MAG: molybdopterin cofactor-binding domain-containing protein [Betaproteobacteria bacterium]
MKRRTFLLTAAGGLGALVVGWRVLQTPRRLRSAAGGGEGISLNGWIELTADGRAILAVPRCEMGQGVYTALAMLAAEELDLPLECIRIMEAPLHRIFGHIMAAEAMLPQLSEDQRLLARGKRWLKQASGRQTLEVSTSTAGSTTLRDLWRPIRMVSAHARATLVNAAARAQAVDPRLCRTEAGFVILPGGVRVAYADVLAKAGELESAPEFALKPREQFRIIGQSPTRIDTPAKSDGSARFASDVRLPAMRYAALAMPPSIGARLVSFRPPANVAAVQVVRVPAGYGQGESLAVIADSWWVAHQTATALDITWDESAGAAIDNETLSVNRKQALDADAGTLKSAIGDSDAAFRSATARLEAEYTVPYLAHAAMEPMNCTAQVDNGVVRVWAPVQAPQVAIAAAAKAAKVNPAAVEMVVPMLGGGFGRRLDADFVFQAVAIAAQAAGRPVQMLWTREQDLRHDFYRPAATARLRAAVDAQARVTALDQKVACESVGRARNGRSDPGRAEAAGVPAEGGLAYAIAHQAYRHVQVNSLLPIGSWRSVDASYNGFFVESFVDEIAAATRRDPVAMRREWLAGKRRHLETLELAIAQSGYSLERQAELRSQGRALGVALFESVGSVVAAVAEVSIAGDRPRVHRVVCAIHCGLAVHPDGIAQQVEGAVIMGVGAALDDGIEVRNGRVVQGNFDDYRVPLMRDVPIVETHIVKSDAAPTGVGEAALPPVAPAIANAVFVLTGKRLRALPLRLG